MLDFSKVIDRRGTDSYKWDGSDRELGNTECIQMGCADMDFETAPELVDALRAVVEHKVYGYATLSPEFAHGVVSWYRTRHNVELKPEWVMHSPRIVISASVVVRTLSQAGDKVILHTPYYPPLDCATQSQGRVAVEPPLVQREDGRFAIDFEQLETLVDDSTKLMIFISPHNPTTRVWTRAELEQLAAFCVKHKLYLFVDEIHCDLTRVGIVHHPVAKLKPDYDIITCVSPSKTFNIAGLQIANMVFSSEKLKNKVAPSHGGQCANPLSIAALLGAYNESEDWLDQVKVYIDGNLKFLKEWLDENLPKIVYRIPDGTYLAWLDVSAYQSDSEKFAFDCGKGGIIVEQGDVFGDGGKGFIRFNVGTPRHLIKEGLERMKKVIQKY